MSDQRPHHEILLEHVNKIAETAKKHPVHVLRDMEEQHSELHDHVKKVVEQTGVPKDHVMRVLHSHASDDHFDGQGGAARSAEWRTYRKNWVHGNKKLGIEPHDTCEGCGSKVGIQVHHKIAFQVEPSKELDYTNYVSLCESITDEHGNPGKECHLNIGHGGHGPDKVAHGDKSKNPGTPAGGGGFHKWNPKVEEDAAEVLKHPDRREKVIARIATYARPIP